MISKLMVELQASFKICSIVVLMVCVDRVEGGEAGEAELISIHLKVTSL
jgi:hypothetical protein